jgi:D-3-phosphoglycerate dehydrogenase
MQLVNLATNGRLNMTNSIPEKIGKVVVSGVAVGPEIEPHWQELRQQTELIILEEHTTEALEAALDDMDVVIIRSTAKLSGEMIKAAGKLRGIIKWGVGYDNIDVAAATQRGLPVVTLPVFLASIAEAVFCFLFIITKRYQRLNDLARAGKRPMLDDRSYTLENKVLGCVGLGRIGRRVARIALAFEMKVLVYDPYLDHAEFDGRDLPLVSLDELLSQSHFVSLHAPLTDENHHMIDGDALAKMRSDAYLINIARGGLVDEAALYRALIEGKIAGAALDTFEVEPVSPDNPLLRLDNVWATPHYLGATWEGLAQVAVAAQDATLRLLRGEHPGYQVVNPEVFKEH